VIRLASAVFDEPVSAVATFTPPAGARAASTWSEPIGVSNPQTIPNEILAVRRATMADDALQDEVERLKAENAALKAQATRGVSIKVSEKGGVSVYGLGRFPVTLYKEQWAKLLDIAGDIRAFIKEHDAQLKTKEPR